MKNSAEQRLDEENELQGVEDEVARQFTFCAQRARTLTSNYRISSFVAILKFLDVLAILFAGFAGYFIRFGLSQSLSPADYLLVYSGTIVTSLSLHIAGAYRGRSTISLTTQLNALFLAGTGALLLILLCGFFSGTLRDYSRIWVMSSILIAGTVLILNRFAVSCFVQRLIQRKQLMESVVIVGVNEQTEKVIDALANTSHPMVTVLGIFDDRKTRHPSTTTNRLIAGTLNDLLSYIRRNQIDRVVVTLPWIACNRLDKLFKKLRTVPVRIDLVPNELIWQFAAANLERLGNIPVLTIANVRIEEQSGLAKRMEDIIISTTLLFILSPLFLIIAFAIKLDSKGPVLFKQRRHGYNNQVFEVYKFRSMKIAETLEPRIIQATRNDPRVTSVGKFLRSYSLDELPQLLNVFIGNMSVVGPRPHAVQHNLHYGSAISEYFARHNVKPGITGWAQVHGLRGEIDSPEKLQLRVASDLYYIENWSLFLDLKIIFLTIACVWFQDTAY